MDKGKILKRVIGVLCVLCVTVVCFSPMTAYGYATYNDTSLISSVVNSENGKLKVTLSVPANTTVSITAYPNRLIGGRQYGTMAEEINVSVTNSTSATKLMTKTISVKFYGEYIVHASRGWNGSIWDEHKVTSKLTITKYSAKYTWTDEAIAKFNQQKTVQILMQTGTAVVVGLVSVSGGIACSVAFACGDVLSTYNSVASESTINETPIRGYSYKFKYVGTNAGIDTYLLCYNTSGNLVKTTYLSTTSYGGDGALMKVIP